MLFSNSCCADHSMSPSIVKNYLEDCLKVDMSLVVRVGKGEFEGLPPQTPPFQTASDGLIRKEAESNMPAFYEQPAYMTKR